MNFRGPLRIQADVNQRPGADDPEAPLEVGLRFFATEAPGGGEVEVELRVGRNGIVFAAPVEDLAAGIEAPGLPANEELRPVPPEARTTPFSVDDFAARG